MSSATQTEGASARSMAGQGGDSSSRPGLPVSPRVLTWGAGLAFLLVGWISILHVYQWRYSAAVFFLFSGWLGLLLSIRFLWRAGMAAAEDTGVSDDEFWKPVGPRDELLREKRALLKAIKEIEFDHQMGKMSEEDAAELTRFYRLQAIELIKALEAEGGEDEGLSVNEQIERELKARMAVSRAGARTQAAAESKKGKQTPDQQPSQKANQKASQKANQKANQKSKKKASKAADEASESGAEASTEVGS